VREATVQGRLYDLPYGFPALVVPEEDVQAIGTTNYLADTEKQNHATPVTRATSPGWDAVHGELFSFDDPEERLPALDSLESFRPGEKSFYKRILIPATVVATGTSVPAWAYTIESASGVYLPGGRWPVS
jgi:gamma-glutamylcyclotransferase (GGCT)/AIG2-like uncharacterized protein YtfP